MKIKYPQVILTIDLKGPNGNAWAIIGLIRRELKKAKVSPKELKQFGEEARAGDYKALQKTCKKWVDVTFCGGDL
jgi:hypothetical protein